MVIWCYGFAQQWMQAAQDFTLETAAVGRALLRKVTGVPGSTAQ
jgi:hypothetical protein